MFFLPRTYVDWVHHLLQFRWFVKENYVVCNSLVCFSVLILGLTTWASFFHQPLLQKLLAQFQLIRWRCSMLMHPFDCLLLPQQIQCIDDFPGGLWKEMTVGGWVVFMESLWCHQKWCPTIMAFLIGFNVVPGGWDVILQSIYYVRLCI